MNSYLITGKDTSSDKGTWIIVVQATDRVQAASRAKSHLRRLGREDLASSASDVEITKISFSDDQVIYSTVELPRTLLGA